MDTMWWRRRALSVAALLLVTCASFTDVWASGDALDVCSTCHVNATCEVNADGRKACNCMYGFVGNGRTHCQDKDECQVGARNICGDHTACHNTHGSFYCTCESGYRPSNNMTVFIPNDGTFCDDIDECQVQDICGEGAKCSNVRGSFSCRCKMGYRIQNGSEPFQPGWGTSYCEAIDCGPPPSPRNAIMLFAEGTRYGSLVSFDCMEGFLLKTGSKLMQCGAQGLWDGPSLLCVEVNCGEPPSVPHAAVLRGQATGMGAEVQYRCHEGFYNAGTGNSSHCTSNGTWDPVKMLCQEVDCGEPPSVPHAAVLRGQATGMGAEVQYRCHEGFYNAGTGNSSHCTSNGSWDPVKMLCQEVDCGEPPSVPHAAVLRGQGTGMGAEVQYRCHEGFYNAGTGNSSHCTSNGSWDHVNMHCQEVDCGEPPSVPHAAVLRGQATGMGAEVQYRCHEGFYNAGTGNSSHCTSRGSWSRAAMICTEIDCGPPAALPNTDMHWGNVSQLGSLVHYTCKEGFYRERGDSHSACAASRKWEEVTLICKALCGPAPTLVHTVVLWQNGTMALHRCQEGYRRHRGSNVSWCDNSGKWLAASLHCREVKPAIRKLEVYNEHCVRWKANVYSGEQEEYKVHFVGSRVYDRFFQHLGGKDFVSGASRLELCLNLLPGTNYSINVTVLSSRFSLCVSTSTSVRAPPPPDVIFRDVESPFPTLWLRRVVHTLDRISVYQVFVLPLTGTVVFDCSSPGAPHFYDCGEPCQAYVTAQISLADVGTEVHFTVGDERHYGGYYNAPLQPGGDYYVILRAVSQWAGVRRQSCVIWAKVRGMSYIIQSTTLIAGGFVGLVALVLFLVHSYTWYCKKT